MLRFVDKCLITTLLDTFTEFMYTHNTNEQNIFFLISSNEAIHFWGHGDFGGSVGKGKQTRFYFRPEHSHFSSMF